MRNIEGIYDSEGNLSLTSVIHFVNQVEKNKNIDDQEIAIYFLKNFTVDGIEPLLKYHLYSNKINPEIRIGEYDNVVQEALNRGSALHQSNSDIVVVSLIIENFDNEYHDIEWKADYALEKMQNLLEVINENLNSIIVLNTFLPPLNSPLGITSTNSFPDKFYEIGRINCFIREFIKNHSAKFFLIDFERIKRLKGADKSIDYRFWHSSKSLFKKDFLEEYSYDLTKIALALKGKSKKCLILDCDNTLWGGIVGEDGINNIKIDKNSYPHKVYYEFQQHLLNLNKRGILLCLCSKNNEEDVFEVLDNHSNCLIKREHLSAWRINWNDKASNIRSLANELNIGLDSMVFVDDSSTECDLIRRTIPEVAVIQVPNKLYEFPNVLYKDGLFDSLNISEEDKKRTELYRSEKTRKNEEKKFESIDDYLSTLDLSIKIRINEKTDISRIAQLTQKTNQFNLTTKRYSEPQIKEMFDNKEYLFLSLSVKDKYGDMGLTGVLIAYNDGIEVKIDTMLLSCRVLGRKVEMAFGNFCVQEMFNYFKTNRIIAEFVPTKKNAQVKYFWENFGFTLLNEVNNERKYKLEKEAFVEESIFFIKIN